MEYNVILGMDWLSTCHAHVDCHQKWVTFKIEGVPKSTYEGTKNKQSIPIISVIKATKLLRKGWQSYKQQY